MKRYAPLLDRIRASYADLPRNQKKVADYIIENIEKAPFQSVQDISEATGASVASVVRFTQSVGYSGFSEMRDQIAAAVKNRLEGSEVFKLSDSGRESDDALTAVANLDVKNINDTLNLNEPESFKAAISLIVKSSRVFSIGLGISNLLSQLLAYQLSQVSINAVSLKRDSVNFMEQILFLEKKDLLICFSFPPYSSETIESAKFARERGIKILSVTNKRSAPITFYSDAHLLVKSENMLFTNSFAAVSALINAMATGCALKNKTKAKKMLNDLNEIAKRQNTLVID